MPVAGPIANNLTLSSGANTVLTSPVQQTVDLHIDIVTAATITVAITANGGSAINFAASKQFAAGDHVVFAGIALGVNDVIAVNTNQADTTCLVCKTAGGFGVQATTNAGSSRQVTTAASVNDDVLIALGTGGDIALVSRSTVLNANTTLSSVIVGTPVTPAVAADTFIVSNITASGDFLLALNRGGNSEAYIWADSSAGDITLYAPLGEILLNPTTDVQILNGTGLIVGHTAQLTVAGVLPELQVLGTTTGVDGSMALVTASTTNSSESQLVIGKVGNASLGSFTTVAQSENLGSLAWVGDDGTDLATVAARIRAIVNASGTVAANRVPTDVVIYQDPGGADDAIEEHFRLDCSGAIYLNQQAQDNVHLSLRSSDVATVLTTIVKGGTVTTADYFTVAKASATLGGAYIQSLAESTATEALHFDCWGGAPATTDTSASLGAMNFFCGQHDGANGDADMAANSNAMVWGEIDAANARLTRMLLKADDGELHLGNATLVALDEEDDIMAVRAMQKVASNGVGIIESAYDNNPFYNYDRLHEMKLVGDKDKDGFFLFPLQPRIALHEGALWQLFVDLMDVVKALPAEIKASLPSRIQDRLAIAAE